jgi:EmrB/QacA subfamily drug resistance transporter
MSEARRLRLVLLTVSAGTFMASLDLFIVNVAYPDLQRAFHGASDTTLSWILNAYAIVFAALPIPFGRFADIYGRRRGFVAGVVVFGLASALCAAAPSVGWLIGARALQAAGAAALLPASLSLLLDEFPVERRARAFGAWAASAGVAAAAGAPVGALLVQVSWHLIFLVNLPIAALTVVGALTLLHESHPGERRLPDIPGALLLILGLGLLTLGIVKGNDWAWGSTATLASLTGGVAALGAFVARCARHPEPVVDLKLFSERSFSAATAVSVLFFGGFGAFVLCNVLFLTRVWDHDVLRAGLEFAPGPITVALVSPLLAPRLTHRYGHRAVTVAGALLFALGALGFIALLDATPRYASSFLPPLVTIATGIGLVAPTVPGAITAALPPDRRATGSAIFAMSRQLGTVLGVAVLVALLAGSTEGDPLTAFHRAWGFLVAVQLTAALTALAIAPPVRAVVQQPATAEPAMTPHPATEPAPATE